MAVCPVLDDGDRVIWYLYLDPKLAETNEVYDKLPEYLEQFDQDERSMDRYVIGAISEMDIPKNPAALWCVVLLRI